MAASNAPNDLCNVPLVSGLNQLEQVLVVLASRRDLLQLSLGSLSIGLSNLRFVVARRVPACAGAGRRASHWEFVSVERYGKRGGSATFVFFCRQLSHATWTCARFCAIVSRRATMALSLREGASEAMSRCFGQHLTLSSWFDSRHSGVQCSGRLI